MTVPYSFNTQEPAFQLPLLPNETGPVLHTNGTPYFIVNTDATAAQSVFGNDPQALFAVAPEDLEADGETSYTNIMVFTNPGFTYLDLALWLVDDEGQPVPSLTSAPEVAVFGLPTPFSTNDLSKIGVHFQPSDAATHFPSLSASISTSKGLWVPLRHPGTGDHVQTWSSTTPQISDVYSASALFSEPIYYLAGVSKVTVVVQTAATISAGACCVLGRMIR